MEAIRIGATTLRLSVEGCVRCGAHYSTAWFPDRSLTVVIGSRKPTTIELHRCADCERVVSSRARPGSARPEFQGELVRLF